MEKVALEMLTRLAQRLALVEYALSRRRNGRPGLAYTGPLFIIVSMLTPFGSARDLPGPSLERFPAFGAIVRLSVDRLEAELLFLRSDR
jgi:hypothetical protein